MAVIIDYFRINKPNLSFAYKCVGLLFTFVAVFIIVGGLLTGGFIAESVWDAIELCLLAILYGNLLGLAIMLIIFFGGFSENRRILKIFSVKNKVFKDIFSLGALCLNVNSKSKLAIITDIIGEYNNLQFKVVRMNNEIKVVSLFNFTKEISPEQEKHLINQGIGIWGIGLYKKLSWREWKDISPEDMYGILELLIKESVNIENE
ncbi:MAG: hypothetical protein LBR46_06655 [Prevotella sp.]|jgi:hypothetical protein|nr:hypothetical protein [Prevotella sp.]